MHIRKLRCNYCVVLRHYYMLWTSKEILFVYAINHSSLIVIAVIHWMLQDKDLKSPSVCEQKQSKMTKFFPHWTKCSSYYLFIDLLIYLLAESTIHLSTNVIGGFLLSS